MPLAGDGVLSFWLSVAYFAWIIVTFVVLTKAISAQERDERAEGPAVGGAVSVG